MSTGTRQSEHGEHVAINTLYKITKSQVDFSTGAGRSKRLDVSREVPLCALDRPIAGITRGGPKQTLAESLT
jgi:hypothetical protein